MMKASKGGGNPSDFDAESETADTDTGVGDSISVSESRTNMSEVSEDYYVEDARVYYDNSVSKLPSKELDSVPEHEQLTPRFNNSLRQNSEIVEFVNTATKRPSFVTELVNAFQSKQGLTDIIWQQFLIGLPRNVFSGLGYEIYLAGLNQLRRIYFNKPESAIGRVLRSGKIVIPSPLPKVAGVRLENGHVIRTPCVVSAAGVYCTRKFLETAQEDCKVISDMSG